MRIVIGDDENLLKLFEKTSKINTSEKVYYDKNGKVVQSNNENTVPKSSYTFAKFSASKSTIDIKPNIREDKSGKKFQSGYKFLDIREWHDTLPYKSQWSLANLTLYEPSGTATGVFVKNSSTRTLGTNVPYYTMRTERKGGNNTFYDYVTVAVMKNNTIKLYESDSKVSAENKVIRELSSIRYAFSGTDILIRNGGETIGNAIAKLNKNRERPKTSIGISGNDLIVAVTVPKIGDRKQSWEIWGNTLRSIDSKATWISMDGGGSPGIIINGVIKQVAEVRNNQPNGRRIATIIAWTD